MALSPLTTTEIAVKKPITNSIMTRIKEAIDVLIGLEAGGGGSDDFSNGSFETDSDGSGTPDNWDLSTYANGTIARYETSSAGHGEACLRAIHASGTSNGGGYADSEYFPCTPDYPFQVAFLLRNSQTGVKNMIQLRYYTNAQAYISDETIYTDTDNPYDWSPEISDLCTIPATARFVKIRVIAGYTDTDPGSTTYIYFDGMRVIYDQWVKDRADTVVQGDNNVVFQDLDTNKEIMIQFDNVGDAGNGTTIQFSDDNGSSFESVHGFTTTNGITGNQTDNTVPITASSWEFIKNGRVLLKRQPNGNTHIDIDIATGSSGGNPADSSFSAKLTCATAINCFKIYAAGNFDQAGASVSIKERSQ